jgi:hypothetical protein
MRLILVSLISACTAFAGDVNLVAKILTTFEEGVSIKRVQFLSDAGAYAVSLDTGTEVERLTDGTRFTFQGLRSATCDIRPSPVPKKQPIAPENYQAYQAAAVALSPMGAVMHEQPEITEQPLPINGWKSYRVAFEYHLTEDPKKVLHRIAVTFITMENTQQVALVTCARATEFAPAHARAESMIRSWYPVQKDTVGN